MLVKRRRAGGGFDEAGNQPNGILKVIISAVSKIGEGLWDEVSALTRWLSATIVAFGLIFLLLGIIEWREALNTFGVGVALVMLSGLSKCLGSAARRLSKEKS